MVVITTDGRFSKDTNKKKKTLVLIKHKKKMEYKEMLLKKIAEYDCVDDNRFACVRAAFYVFNEILVDNMLAGGRTSDVQSILEELEESL